MANPLPYRAVVTVNTVSTDGTLTYRIDDTDGTTVRSAVTLTLPTNTTVRHIRRILQEAVTLAWGEDSTWPASETCKETESFGNASTTRIGITQLAVDNEATSSKVCKSDDPRLSNDRTANNLRTATTQVGISSATAPSANQAVVATSSTAATWQAVANSVFGRTGAVVATAGDYTAAQVTNAESTANKNVADGYAGLDAGIRVPTARLGSGTADSTTFLRGDQTYAVPAGGSASYQVFLDFGTREVAFT